MRHARRTRVALGILLGSLVVPTGCTHNYYYGANAIPACGPIAAPGSVQFGSVCEVPTQVVGGSSVVAQSPARSSAVGPKPPRVVISEPSNPNARFPWKRTDPESGLATRVEGALDDPSVNR